MKTDEVINWCSTNVSILDYKFESYYGIRYSGRGWLAYKDFDLKSFNIYIDNKQIELCFILKFGSTIMHNVD